MTQPRTVLVVGGGAAGNAVTILLRRAGVTVDLVEARDDWNATAGSGITLQGNALRVLRELGVWEQVEASGYGFGSVGITAPDGTVLHVQDDLRTGGVMPTEPKPYPDASTCSHTPSSRSTRSALPW
ncbi:FAD-dependent monooxygenase, partial [Streptomyces sp. NPDC002530]